MLTILGVLRPGYFSDFGGGAFIFLQCKAEIRNWVSVFLCKFVFLFFYQSNKFLEGPWGILTSPLI